MGLPRSTYYFELKKVDAVAKRNSQLSHEIRTIFKKYQGRYGVRRVYQTLRNQGLVVNHKRVQRIMHREGLLGKCPREKYHSYRSHRSEERRAGKECRSRWSPYH